MGPYGLYNNYVAFLSISNHVPLASKFPLPPTVADFIEENFLRYLDLFYVNPRLPQIEDLPSIIGCQPIKSFNKLSSQNLPPWG